MKEPSQVLLISSIFVLLLWAPLTAAQKHQDITTFPFKENFQISLSTPKFYKIDLSNAQIQDLDLSISVLPEGRSNAPKLFVSRNKEFPRNEKDSDYSGTTPTGNIVFISNQEVKDSKILYVGLACSNSKCNSKFEVEFTKEIKAVANGEKTVEGANSLNGAGSAVVRLIVPKTDDADRLVIHIDAITSNRKEVPKLEVFINQGNDIPYTNRAEYVPRSSWFEGSTIIIHKGTNMFCTGCTYTLSLKFTESSSLSLEAHVYKKTTEIYGTSTLDGVQREESNSYSFTLREAHKEEDFVVSVRLQQGKVKIYINCDTMPSSFSGYYWSYLVEEFQEIVLTKKEHSKCSTENYYFLVYGEESSVYSFRASYKSSRALYMAKSRPVKGDIFPMEKITYEVIMPIFAAEEILLDLRWTKELQYNIINCRFSTDCPGILPAGSEFKVEDSYGFDKNVDLFDEFKFSKDPLTNGVRIKINPHESGCYPVLIQDKSYMKEPMPVCAYLITLSSSHTGPVEYTLKYDSKGHNLLFPGTPKLDSVAKGNDFYYILYVPHKNVKSVEIQLTKFSGDVDIYVSKKNKYPITEGEDTNFSHEGFIVFKDMPDLSGTYYIGIHGLQTSSFSISATIKTENGVNEDYALKLDHGVPQKGVLLSKHEHPAQFYKFSLDKEKVWKGSIRISVNTLRGKVILAVNNNGEVPTPNLQTWKAKGNDLEISSKDANFKEKGVYHIGIFVDWSDPDAKSLSDITFNVAYYVKDEVQHQQPQSMVSSHMFLSPNTPFYGGIKRGEVNYFEAFILKDDSMITVYKQADSGDVDLYLSFSPEIKYPNKVSYSYTTKDSHKDYIVLNSKDIQKACESSDVLFCSFYIAVFPSRDQEETYYSLSMKRDFESQSTPSPAVALEDGRLTYWNVPRNEVPVMFYYYAVPNQHSIVTVSCPGREIVVYARRIVVDLGALSKPEIQKLGANNYEISSQDNQNHPLGLAYLYVPPISDESATTVISLSVYFKDPDTAGMKPADIVRLKENLQTFTILVSSQITMLLTGSPYFGFVPKDKYTYIYVKVTRPECTLLVTMTTLDDGDPDLVISYGFDARPTISEHMFSSISKQRTEVIEINNADIYPLKSMAGYWIIGVYGKEASAFTLTAVYEDQKMVDLKSGVPFEMYLKSSSVMYLKFFHEYKKNIQIKLDKISGSLDAYVTAISTHSDLASHLPNATNHKWKIELNSGVVNVGVDDKYACVQCLYVIGIQATTASKFIITLTEGEGFTQIQNGMNYNAVLKAKETASYVLSSANAEEAILNVYMRGMGMNVMVSHSSTLNASNYLWKESLTGSDNERIMRLEKHNFDIQKNPDKVWDGKRHVPTQKNSFYILFENPNQSGEVTYDFSIMTKDSSFILKDGVKQLFSLKSRDSSNLLYYASEERVPLKVILEFSVRVKNEDRSAFETALREGLHVVGHYWQERATSGPGEWVIFDPPQISYETSSTDKGFYYLRQTMRTESKIGKYNLEVSNPWFFDTDVIIRMYTPKTELIGLDQNSQHRAYFSNTEDEGETYEIYMNSPGKWYLWTYSCYGTIDLRIEDQAPVGASSSPAKSIITLEKGRDYLHQETIGNNERMRYVTVRRDAKETNQAMAYVSSSMFEESEFRSYELKENANLEQSVSLDYKPPSSVVDVKIKPVEFRDIDPSDRVNYYVRLCPIDPYGVYQKDDFCSAHSDCETFNQEVLIKDMKTVTASFKSVKNNNYYVQTITMVVHKGKMIKFITYPVDDVIVRPPVGGVISNNLGTIFLGVIVLLLCIAVFAKCFKKIKAFTADSGFELPSFVGKQKNYEYLGDA